MGTTMRVDEKEFNTVNTTSMLLNEVTLRPRAHVQAQRARQTLCHTFASTKARKGDANMEQRETGKQSGCHSAGERGKDVRCRQTSKRECGARHRSKRHAAPAVQAQDIRCERERCSNRPVVRVTSARARTPQVKARQLPPVLQAWECAACGERVAL